MHGDNQNMTIRCQANKPCPQQWTIDQIKRGVRITLKAGFDNFFLLFFRERFQADSRQFPALEIINNLLALAIFVDKGSAQ